MSSSFPTNVHPSQLRMGYWTLSSQPSNSRFLSLCLQLKSPISRFKNFTQKSKNDPSFVSVVVLDEIGLAEDSSNLPLKVLHSLLEEQQVAFIGISNWALDPAKMNRGVPL